MIKRYRGQVILNCFWEYKRKISSIRFFGAVVMMIALVCAMATGIDRLMLDKQEWITQWMAPHFFNNIYFITFYGFIVCYVFSDVPFMNQQELYRILREGRILWCIGKMASIFLQAFTMTALTIAASALVFIPRLKFEWTWGKIIYTMAYSNNMEKYNMIGNPSAVILTKYTPIQAMGLCFLIVWMVSSLIGLLMFAISLYLNRMLAVSVAIAVTGLNLSSGRFFISAWLPYVTPFYWCRMSIYEEQIFLDWYYPSYPFYLLLSCIIVAVLVFLILLRAGHMEFQFNKEE